MKIKRKIIIFCIIIAAILITVGLLYKESDIKEEQRQKQEQEEKNKEQQELLENLDVQEIITTYENQQTQLKQIAKSELDSIFFTEEIKKVDFSLASYENNYEYIYKVETENFSIIFKENGGNIVIQDKNYTDGETSNLSAEEIAKNVLKNYTFLEGYTYKEISETNTEDGKVKAIYETAKSNQKGEILPNIEIEISLATGKLIRATYLYEAPEISQTQAKISREEAEEKAIEILNKFGYGKDLKVSLVEFGQVVPNNYFTKVEGEIDSKSHYRKNAYIVTIESDLENIKVYVDSETGEVLGAREF